VRFKLFSNTKINQKLLFILVVSIFLIISVMLFNKPASAAYDGGNIIDNAVFLDSSTMSKEGIQEFLVEQGGAIAGRTFTMDCVTAGAQANLAYIALGAPCGQTTPASHIIYYSSQVYGVNPRVILATMQKEQSLITATNPTNRQYVQAMGYGCPTTGSCDDTSNFFWQVDNGTWVLRFHYERARGNFSWWYTSTTWTCGTEKNFYKPNLYPNQNVDFYDEDGVKYRTHFIENAATSSFYCYTPHAYNNPQGLYGRAPYGTTGRYYSGSYNFVYWFEIWFDTTKTPSFKASYSTQSPSFSLNAGETKKVQMSFRNTGTAFWKDDVSKFPGYSPVRLATSKVINRNSDFRASNWINGSRPSGTFSKVLKADGSESLDGHTVNPGEIGRFEFNLTIPNDTKPGLYREYFQPILEGSTSWDLGTLVWIEINVLPTTYKAEYVSQSPYPKIVTSTKSTGFFKYKNAGTGTWYKNTSAPERVAYVSLASTSPINKPSIFSSTNWSSKSRPADSFKKVYDSNGNIATDQTKVSPGQIAEFEFDLTANINVPNGQYREYFQPILEGSSNWNMQGLTYLNIDVQKPRFEASYVSQSPYPSIRKGEAGLVNFKFRNTGNMFWKDDSSTFPGYFPTRLATTNPINRISAIKHTGLWTSANRPNGEFTRVFESDGSTPAQDQNTVYPGQIVQYDFYFYVPLSVATGTYREWFQPVLEGAPNWELGVKTFLDVTVTN
jgi:hypothetical protein